MLDVTLGPLSTIHLPRNRAQCSINSIQRLAWCLYEVARYLPGFCDLRASPKQRNARTNNLLVVCMCMRVETKTASFTYFHFQRLSIQQTVLLPWTKFTFRDTSNFEKQRNKNLRLRVLQQPDFYHNQIDSIVSFFESSLVSLKPSTL